MSGSLSPEANPFGEFWFGVDLWLVRNMPLLQMVGGLGPGLSQGAHAPAGQRATFGRALGMGMENALARISHHLLA
jgi:hypothetical protein